MRKLLIAALAGAQIAAAQPAWAADFADAEQIRAGAFAGFRVRVPLDGDSRERHVRAGLAVAPTLHSRTLDGGSRVQFGEGIELGLSDGRAVQLSLAGTPVSRLAPGQDGPDGERAGISTLGWVAIGAGVVIGAVLVLFQLCADGEVCGSE